MTFSLFSKLHILLVALPLGLGACATPNVITQEPVLPSSRLTQNALFELPPPAAKLDVAVYSFEDVTGQFKPAEGYQNLSRAVSQGGASILVKALQDAGNRSWFTVIERASLNNLLQERKIITQMRKQYLNETEVDSKFLPPMRFAGIIMEGGIVGYDSNTLTGGAGARLLGIGALAEYRQDTISVDLRAISVKTGEVLASTVVHKTLISAGISGSSFSYIDVDKLLEVEAGVSTNEPGLIALTKAIEKAVHTLVLEGADLNLWAFKDENAARPLINAHRVASGRNPLPDLAATEIAQQVNTKVSPEVATAPSKKVTRALPAKASPNLQKSPPVNPKGNSANAVATTDRPVERAGGAPQVKGRTLVATSGGATATQAPTRKLPVAQKPRRVAVSLDSEIESSAVGGVPVVTKVSP